MNEGQQWSAMGVATWSAWGVVAALIVGMWVALWFDQESAAQALGFTACAGSAVAATLHIRRFMCRTQRMVRTLLGVQVARGADFDRLHPVE